MHPRRQLPHAPRHAERLTHEAIENRTARVRGARVFPGTAQLRGDLALAGLRRIQSTGNEQQMLDRRLPRPCTQYARGFTGFGLASRQDAEHFLAQVAGRRTVLGGIQHLDAVTGTDVEDLGGFEQSAQCRQARRYLRPRDGKAGHLVHPGMAIGEPYDTNLVHSRSLTAGTPGGCH